MYNRTSSNCVITIVALSVMLLAHPAASVGETMTDTAAYARVLERLVTADGRVKYAALKADPADLDRYLESIASVGPQQLAALPEAGRIAFWLNAYNAITLKTIVDSYPIQAGGFSAMRYPASSIRQISGAWSNRDWTVMGRKMSLDDIEHKTLRKRFQEPRVHMALVCGALGCPPLRNEPYQGARLDEQLDDQARRYLASPVGLHVAHEGRKVAVSSIFKWFKDDFDAAGGVRRFASRYASEEASAALEDEHVKLIYLDYDWSLNEAQAD